ncbi:hypothetical protein IW144_005794 [Coemansia sp. RSA 522]|nr:hypothetical protein IW144_005794 [Coemansia sp. RSA 522]
MLGQRLWQTRSRLCRPFVRNFTIAIDGPAASGKSSTARAVAHELGFGYIDSGSIYRCATLLALRQQAKDDSPEVADLITNAHLEINILPNTRQAPQRVTGMGRLCVPDVQVLMNGEDVSREIRSPEVNRHVAKIASDGQVRKVVLDIQRSLAAAAKAKSTGCQTKGTAANSIPSGVVMDGREAEADGVPGGVVMDGRDIGTTVFPQAELKIYLDASAMARAIRRWDELNSQLKETETGANQPVYPSVEDIARELEERDYADINRTHSPLRIAKDAVVIDNTNMTFEQQVYSITDLARERLGLERKYDDI